MEPLLGALCRAPHLDATAPCSTSRRNGPLLHIPKQQPPAPHPEATAPCSTFRSRSTLLRISEHGIGRQTMPRNGRNGPLSPGRARLPRPRPHAKRPHDQTARATRDTPPTANSQRPVGQRPTGQRQRVRRQTDHQFGRQLPSARPAAARSGQRAPPGQPATASAASMSVARSDGCTVGAYRSMTWPSRPTRNFAKFHLMALPSSPLFSDRSHL